MSDQAGMWKMIGEFAAAVLAAATPVIVWQLKRMLDTMKEQKEETAAAKQAVQDVNDAVNHRHRYANGEDAPPPKLYDLAIRNHDQLRVLTGWMKGYEDSTLPNADAVNTFTTEVHARLDSHAEAIDSQGVKLDEIRDLLKDTQASEELIAAAMVKAIQIVGKCADHPREDRCEDCPGGDQAGGQADQA